MACPWATLATNGAQKNKCSRSQPRHTHTRYSRPTFYAAVFLNYPFTKCSHRLTIPVYIMIPGPFPSFYYLLQPIVVGLTAPTRPNNQIIIIFTSTLLSLSRFSLPIKINGDWIGSTSDSKGSGFVTGGQSFHLQRTRIGGGET